MNKIWPLGINISKSSIYSSDHPVSQIYHEEGPPWGGQGWLSPGMEVALPLSPESILILLPRELYSPLLREFSGDGLVPNRTFELKKEHVQYYNSREVFQSYDFLFSNNSDFSQAQKVLKELPKYANPYRKRASVQAGWGDEELPEDWGQRKKHGSFSSPKVED